MSQQSPYADPEDDPYGSQEHIPYIPRRLDSPPPTPSISSPEPAPDSAPHTPQPASSPPGEAKLPARHPGFSFKTLAFLGVTLLVIAASLGARSLITQAVQNKVRLQAVAVAATTTTQAGLIATAEVGTAQAAATGTAQVQATATVYASLNPYPAFQKIAITDPLVGNGLHDWYVGPENDPVTHSQGGCTFTQDAYDASSEYKVDTKGLVPFTICSAGDTNFRDLVYQVQMKMVKGDCGGLTVRGDANDADFYLFQVCQDGTFSFERYKSAEYPNTNLNLAGGSSSAIKQGPEQVNLIAIAAHGDTFDLYVNKQHIGSARNGEYYQGEIGLVAAPSSKNTEVVYNNVQVWTPS